MNNNSSKNKLLHRKQLIAENGTSFLLTLIFSKLVLFTRYPLLNIPIKATLIYVYSATLDPLVIFSSYKLTRIIEELKVEEP